VRQVIDGGFGWDIYIDTAQAAVHTLFIRKWKTDYTSVSFVKKQTPSKFNKREVGLLGLKFFIGILYKTIGIK
jgi:hypothetical protein